MRKCAIAVVLVALGMMVLTPTLGHAQTEFFSETLRIVTFRPMENEGIRFAVRLQTEALRRLGYGMELLVVPGKRASVMASSGEVDGELARNAGYGKLYPDMVRVDERIALGVVEAYSLDPELKLDGWESLRGRELRVECQRGMSNVLSGLAGVVPDRLLTTVGAVEQGLKRLLIGRVDLFVGDGFGTRRALESEDFLAFKWNLGTEREIHVAGRMDEIVLYPWLNHKHADLAPKYAEVLREMKRDGTFERLAREVGGPSHWFRW